MALTTLGQVQNLFVHVIGFAKARHKSVLQANGHGRAREPPALRRAPSPPRALRECKQAQQQALCTWHALHRAPVVLFVHG